MVVGAVLLVAVPELAVVVSMFESQALARQCSGNLSGVDSILMPLEFI
jgi:hypothetical protein